MMTFTRAFVVLGLLSSASTSGQGQQTPSPHAVTKAEAATTISRSRQLVSPSLASAVRNVAPIVLFQATKDDEEAAIQFSVNKGQKAWVFGLETKPDEESPTTSLMDLTGLSTGTNASLGISGVKWWGGVSPESPPADMITAWCKSKQTSKRLDTAVKCESFSNDQLPAALNAELRNLVTFTGTPIMWMLEAKGGPTEFNFVDGANPPDTVDKWQSSFRAGVGRYAGNAFVSLGVAYKVSYKAGDEAAYCSPIPASTSLQCSDQTFGVPAEKKGFAGALDVKWMRGGNFGVNARGGYDETKKAWSVQLPFYFVGDDDDALIGGIIPAWKSTEKHATVTVFVGSAFGMTIVKP